MAMEYIAKRLNGQGNVVMMHGFMGQAAQIKRDQGAREILEKQPGLKLLADQTAEWDRAKAMSLMENWIQSYGAGSMPYLPRMMRWPWGHYSRWNEPTSKTKWLSPASMPLPTRCRRSKTAGLTQPCFKTHAGRVVRRWKRR